MLGANIIRMGTVCAGSSPDSQRFSLRVSVATTLRGLLATLTQGPIHQANPKGSSKWRGLLSLPLPLAF